ncbi:glycoside hydrolase family 57 protein [Marinimicrobium alkaliphilum]|uniref:glycoside hydrolase family 57 protein n=1 Tax=Marinimicrobium alkaliphilum TaxID=2202654 RepID=UPI000DB97143|nr:glycoside hydrolase family 57 protein [Marinimicrobium alkaliphilum]
MSSKPMRKTPVVLCWHMHQPDYRDRVQGQFEQPWTYLHGTKDYIEMAAHLEAHPKAKAVVNFAPILLDQLTDYGTQINAYLAGEGGLNDPMLAALVGDDLPEPGSEDFDRIAHQCLKVNRTRVIERFPAFAALATLVETDHVLRYVGKQFLWDLLVWYHLGWMGETVRRNDERIQALQDKEWHFDSADRRLLLGIIGELINGIGPRYRRLVASGQVELAMSPWAHPIVPLMLDLNSAKEAIPDVAMPEAETYPGGEARARWHIETGLRVFEGYFGTRPAGCWASEGALSNATLALLDDYDFEWTATGDSVLHNSLRHPDNGALKETLDSYHWHYRFGGQAVRCFFRDDGLSDLIGFKYADWHADDAVGDLIHHMENIAKAQDSGDTIISIIMDGENAWEYYPENGWYFLDGLYQQLTDHPHLELTTYRDLIDREEGPDAVHLKNLVAGSWVYGTFSTWIGDNDKNLGWDLLCAAKSAYDQRIDQLDEETRRAATEQLGVCEGSDWFWWFGDYNPADSVSDFERLYRLHLSNLYRLLDLPVPPALLEVMSVGSGAPEHGGVMRHGHAEAEEGGRR